MEERGVGEDVRTTFEPMKSYTERLWCECGGELSSTGQSYWNGSGSVVDHSYAQCLRVIQLNNQRFPRIVQRPESWTPPA